MAAPRRCIHIRHRILLSDLPATFTTWPEPTPIPDRIRPTTFPFRLRTRPLADMPGPRSRPRLPLGYLRHRRPGVLFRRGRLAGQDSG